ncbi:MAG: hypothetical protein LC768_11850 [Acidobacteria bacterium]|nr:hypothetical protein [Acidobacteriota bacterium]MCA1639003.1 hypothetical protein [Acidobacteriota bacterium]
MKKLLIGLAIIFTAFQTASAQVPGGRANPKIEQELLKPTGNTMRLSSAMT